MCAIFGWYKPQFARGVDKERLFRHLARKSQMYGEKSFGVAGRKVGSGTVVGQPASTLEVIRYTGSASSWLEQNAKELKKYAALDVLIGHTRMPTHGAVTKLNAHPFPIGDWLAAHNGVVRNSSDLMRRAVYVAKGETDSEEALCYVVGENFSTEALSEIEGSFAFEAISRDGRKGWLICDEGQSLHVAKIGTGFVWCTDGQALDSSLRAAGAGTVEIERMHGEMVNLATGEVTKLKSKRSAYTPSWERNGLEDDETEKPWYMRKDPRKQAQFWPGSESAEICGAGQSASEEDGMIVIPDETEPEDIMSHTSDEPPAELQ